MIVKIIANDKGNPPGKLADAELHFTDGPLEGLKLIGFGIWERRTRTGRNVTFPARTYSVNGERRSFALLRPTADAGAQDRIREIILEAYAEYENPPAQTITRTAAECEQADRATENAHDLARRQSGAADFATIDHKCETAGSQLGNATARALRF